MPISVTDPINLAMERTKRILFTPFDVGKWFTLGFCAFLAGMGEGGSIYNFPGTGGGGGGGPLPGAGGPAQPGGGLGIEPAVIIAIVVAVALIVLGITILVTWLTSRGQFMFLDGIVYNRGAVKEPWRRFRTLGNSLFGFSLLFGLITIVVLAAIGGIGVAIAWPDIRTGQPGGAAIVAILVGIAMILPTALAVMIISLIVHELVVPTMYLRGERIMTAWATVRRELLPGHVWPIVLFFLMRFVLSIGIGVIALLATCLTCCIAVLPYIGTVILLPLSVFMRSYTLHFLEQFGPQWRFFPVEGPFCNVCRYNLTGNISGICPECGTPIGTMPSAPPTSPFPPVPPPAPPAI